MSRIACIVETFCVIYRDRSVQIRLIISTGWRAWPELLLQSWYILNTMLIIYERRVNFTMKSWLAND